MVKATIVLLSGGDAGTFRGGGKVTLRYVTLAGCIRFAYDIPTVYQIFGPDWIQSRSYLFEIVGQSAPGTEHARLRLMLQALLAERFQLALHRERRVPAFYALTVSGKKSRLRPRGADSDDYSTNGIGAGRIVYNQRSMPELAMLLSAQLGRPVLDRTGVDGRYDIRLTWTPDSAQQSAPGPSLFTAIQEQLGLRLKSVKEPLDVIVVERAQKAPVEN